MINNAKIENIEFKGYMSKENLDTVIKNAICIVVPSLCYDNSPTVIYESFVMGKPVIGANIGGIPELIDDGVNGFLFERSSASDLSGKIEHLLNNHNRIIEMSKNARQKEIENHNCDLYYERLIQVYQALIRNK